MSDAVFDAYSAYYDLFYQDKPYEQEVAWLIERMRRYSPAAQTLLDLGCGTGTYTELFAQYGYEVLGVDLSPLMIERARKRGSASYTVGDVRSYRASEPVDIITLLFHVMSYQTRDEAVRRTLQACYDNLQQDGLLCFDVWHRPAVLAQQPQERMKECAEGDLCVSRHASPVHHVARNIVDVHYDITVEAAGGTSRFQEVHSMRYFDTEELVGELTSAGFDVLEVTELISGASPSAATWGVCYFARRSR